MSKQSKYQKHFVDLIYECITDKFMYLKDIAKVMNINYDTLNEWLKEDSKYFKSELSESYHRALRDKQTRLIEKTKEHLYKSVWGYDYEEVKKDNQGNIIHTITKHKAPNWQGCLAILQNLDPQNWSNKQSEPIENECCRIHREISEMTDEELTAEIEKLENNIK